MDVEKSNFYLSNCADSGPLSVGGASAYGKELASCLLQQQQQSLELSSENFHSSSSSSSDIISSNTRILAFKGKAPEKRREDLRSLLAVKPRIRSATATAAKSARIISPNPEKILDAPEMLDDYYLNLLDWSSQNVLAVALNSSVYLWDANSGTVDQLMELSDSDYVCSVSWSQDGYYLSVGTSNAQVQLWDVETKSKVRTMSGQASRIGCTAWNQHLLSSGCRDGSIFHNDVRVANHHVASLLNHTQEVCGLKWSPDGTQLASGGNDNILNIWDASSSQPRFSLTHHRAAVKALAWCPWQPHLLASGGGSYDKCIKFWNTVSGNCTSSIDTGSQVCSLLWSLDSKEIVSSHGYADNQLSVWRYPSMTKVVDLYGHSSRVLHMAMSPDGQTVVSGAADENLKFWRIFESAAASKKASLNTTPTSKLESKLRKVIR